MPKRTNNWRVRPAQPRDEQSLLMATRQMQDALFFARKAGCPSLAKKIGSALKSAEGARRHMRRRLARGKEITR